MWSLRNNTNMEESGVLLSLDYTAQHGQELLKDFYEKSKRSVTKATTEGPAAWAIVNDGRRPALAAQLANLLQKQGVEVQKLEQDFEARETPSPTVKAAEEKAEAKTESKVGDKKKMEKSEKSKEEATAILNAYAKVKLIMAICSPAVPGAAEAVRQSPRSVEVKVIGLGLPNDNKA
jgi:hypothetical protein